MLLQSEFPLPNLLAKLVMGIGATDVPSGRSPSAQGARPQNRLA
jgi:hypothetical protein